MVWRVSKKWVLVVSIVILAGIVIAGYFIFINNNPTPKRVLESRQLKDDLAKGKCADRTIANLKSVTSQNSSEQGKLYEDLGLCYVYSHNYQAALDAYTSARQAYVEAGLNDNAKKLDGAILGVKTAASPDSGVGPEDFKDPGGGM